MSNLDPIDKGRGIAVPKARADIYTVLLGIALVAILIAITLLCLELGRYGWDYNARSVQYKQVSLPVARLPFA